MFITLIHSLYLPTACCGVKVRAQPTRHAPTCRQRAVGRGLHKTVRTQARARARARARTGDVNDCGAAPAHAAHIQPAALAAVPVGVQRRPRPAAHAVPARGAAAPMLSRAASSPRRLLPSAQRGSAWLRPDSLRCCLSYVPELPQTRARATSQHDPWVPLHCKHSQRLRMRERTLSLAVTRGRPGGGTHLSTTVMQQSPLESGKPSQAAGSSQNSPRYPASH